MGDVVVVLTTVPTGDKGQEIAQTLVEERLAACVNVLAPMTSTYRWRGAVERESDHQVIIKTTLNRVPAVQTRLAALHPYEVPEFLVLSVADSSSAYFEWVVTETKAGDESPT
jgi:periplasmic divalent cation tolerance protein